MTERIEHGGSAPPWPSLPAATYRLQLRPGFGFEAARGLLDYLQRLGIDWLYLSPVFAARPGSEHGYDIVDPTRIRAELGGEAEFERLLAALRRRSMGLLLDIVPNHMAAAAANPWWWDVLKHGQSSPSARFFDIDWDAGGGRVILPVLGRTPNEAIARGELRLDQGSPHDDEEPVVRYWGRAFPIAPGSPEGPIEAVLAVQSYRLLEWRSGGRRINYRRFFDIDGLVGLRVEDEVVFDTTHRLIRRLVRSGAVSGLRVDHIDGLRDPAAYLHRLRRQVQVPAESAEELSAARGGESNQQTEKDLRSAAGRREPRPRQPIVLVEKILARNESLPEWPVEGTTGYEMLDAITRLFIDPEGAARLRSDAARRTGVPEDFEATRRQAKRDVLETIFPAELDRLTARLAALAGARGGGAPPEALRHALVETTAALDVYRTYGPRPANAEERSRLDAALRAAGETPLVAADLGSAAQGATVEPEALAALAAALLGDLDGLPPDARAATVDFVARWQQLSGAAMAKGHEDTALYRDVALPALAEVGGEPVVPHQAVAAFHRLCAARAARFPLALNATATHDTKLGEDTRSRLAVLTELAEPWIESIDRWACWHGPLRRTLDRGPAPSPDDEILIYRTLLAMWPAAGEPGPGLVSRLVKHLRKALREAKVRSSWRRPDEAYEAAVGAFAAELAIGPAGARFRDDSASTRSAMARHGAINSLSQLVLKTMAPGVPDFYQGSELWQLTLVDPDNRRVPDFDRRRRQLAELSATTTVPRLAALRHGWRRGTIKLALTRRLLALRRAAPELFAAGDHVPIEPAGRGARHLCAFARRLGPATALILVPRLTVALAGDDGWPLGEAAWGDTTVPWSGPRDVTEWLTGRDLEVAPGFLRVAQVLDLLPVAVLVAGAAEI
ncbi:MAG TPA: malto-oligosyltrehalose synthase [Thermoanaerobaculia bacterium]|nr:malto-oligosyltrehalose synthase [Thermoanaerobaculia bacterium]